MVKLPWIRNRNGGSTSAARMTMRRVASIACWRAESRAQRPARASVAAMSRTCARSADVVKDGSSQAFLMSLYCTLWHGLAQSATRPQGVRVGGPGVDIAGVLGFVLPKRASRCPLVPAKAGTREQSTHKVSESGPPLSRGRTESAARKAPSILRWNTQRRKRSPRTQGIYFAHGELRLRDARQSCLRSRVQLPRLLHAGAANLWGSGTCI